MVIFVGDREEIKGCWRKVWIEELHGYCSAGVIGMDKLWTVSKLGL